MENRNRHEVVLRVKAEIFLLIECNFPNCKLETKKVLREICQDSTIDKTLFLYLSTKLLGDTQHL